MDPRIEREPLLKPMPTYTHDYNPAYADQDLLEETKRELRSMEGVATPEDIEEQLAFNGRLVRGEIQTAIVMTGNCELPIAMENEGEDLDSATEEIVDRIDAQQAIVADLIPDSQHHSRSVNQHFKPRSNEFEKDGITPSYYGSGINSKTGSRQPDPRRMEAAAVLSRDIQEHFTARHGVKLKTEHEALLIPYEDSFLREEDGELFLTSAITPRIGERSRHLDSPQVEMLKHVKNPVAIKIGPSATAEDIQGLHEALNPDNIDGKLVFVLRIGSNKTENLDRILRGIAQHAPNALILSDPMHGNTEDARLGDGTKVKTRPLTRIKSELSAVIKACNPNGLRLHGLHLEANGRDDRQECVNQTGDNPEHESMVDPELNNAQLREVVEHVAPYFNRATSDTIKG